MLLKYLVGVQIYENNVFLELTFLENFITQVQAVTVLKQSNAV